MMIRDPTRMDPPRAQMRKNTRMGVGSHVLLQLCTVLLASACCLSAQSKNPQDLTPGTILVARRKLSEPLFRKSVILLVRYSKNGALGLMVNRKTKVPISHVMKGLKGATGTSAPIFVGGPVDLGAMFALARAPRKPEGTTEVSGDIYVINTKTTLGKLLGRTSNTSTLRIYVGYCGWGSDQLENEVRRGSWYIFNHSEDMAFDANPATLWSRLIVRAHEKLVLWELILPVRQGRAMYPWRRYGAR